MLQVYVVMGFPHAGCYLGNNTFLRIHGDVARPNTANCGFREGDCHQTETFTRWYCVRVHKDDVVLFGLPKDDIHGRYFSLPLALHYEPHTAAALVRNLAY